MTKEPPCTCFPRDHGSRITIPIARGLQAHGPKPNPKTVTVAPPYDSESHRSEMLNGTSKLGGGRQRLI